MVECRPCLDRRRRRGNAGASDTGSFDGAQDEHAAHLLEEEDDDEFQRDLGLQERMTLLLNEIYTAGRRLPPGVDHADPATNDLI